MERIKKVIILLKSVRQRVVPLMREREDESHPTLTTGEDQLLRGGRSFESLAAKLADVL